MLNLGCVIGTVTSVYNDRDATVVVVRTASGTKQGGGAWTEEVACRFWGDKVQKYVEGVGEGMLVKVDGSVKSRAGREGGHFTSFECRYLQKLSKPGAQHTRTTSRDDDIADDSF